MSYLVQSHSTTNLRSAKAHSNMSAQSLMAAGFAVGTFAASMAATVRIGQRASGLMPAASMLQPKVAVVYGYNVNIQSIDKQHGVVKVVQT